MDRSKARLGRICLLITTLIWGSSFVILKNTLDSISTLYVLAFRFTGATVLMALIGIRELKKLDRAYITGGVVMGLFLFSAYVLQTYGLTMTTPGKNAFLTSTYCIMVPFFYWAYKKRRPDRYNVSAAFMCIVAVGLISLSSEFKVNLGDLLTVCCGVFYAMHIIATAEVSEGRSAVMLSMVQFAVAAVLSWICALAREPFPTGVPTGAALSIVYLCVMCTAVCFLCQTIGQKYTPPSQVAVLMTLESVFGALVSVIFYREVVSLRLFFGFLLMFIALLVSETKLSFLRRKPEADLPSDEDI